MVLLPQTRPAAHHSGNLAPKDIWTPYRAPPIGLAIARALASASAYARIDQLDAKVAAIDATVPAQKRIRLRHRMGADEEVGHQAIARAVRAAAALTPQATRRNSGLIADRFESDAETFDGSLKGPVIVEVGAYLSPHNVTGDERPSIVCRAQGFPRD